MRLNCAGRRCLTCIILTFIIVSLTAATGCWDKIEIDERAFVLAVAVDLATGNSQGTGDAAGNNQAGKLTGEELSGEPSKDRHIKAMFFMPVPSKLAAGSVDAFTYEISEGRNVPSAVQELSMRFSRRMFFGQTKLILLSSKFLQNELVFREFIDYLEREPDMGRGAIVAVLDKSIDELVNVKPKFEKVFASYVTETFSSASMQSADIKLRINDLLASLRGNGGRCLIPVISVQEDEIIIKRLGLVDGFKLDGFVDFKYLKGFGMITDTMNDGNLVLPFKGNNLTYRIKMAKTKIKVNDMGNKLDFKVTTTLEGDINDYMFNLELAKPEEIEEARMAVAGFAKKLGEKTAAYLQNDVGKDYFKLGQQVKKHNYRIYAKYKNNWDEAFRNASFHFDTTAYIRRLGGVKK